MRRFFKLLFMPCEGISARVSESLDRELTRSERFAVWSHLLYCRACRRYRQQVLYLRKIFASATDEISSSQDLQLGEEARERIVSALKSS